MAQNKVEIAMKKKFNTFTKLSIGFGASLMIVVALWFTLLTLEVTDVFSLWYHDWLKYIYYVIFFFASLMVPAWIATSAGSAINSLCVIKIDTRKYKIEVLVASIVSILFIAIGSLIILMGMVQGTDDVKKINWIMIGSGTLLMLIALAAVIFGVVCNILALNKSKKK